MEEGNLVTKADRRSLIKDLKAEKFSELMQIKEGGGSVDFYLRENGEFITDVLIMVNGKITGTQVAVGYLGLFLLGASSLAIGLFASALTKSQVIALMSAAAINSLMVLLFPLARFVVEPPLKPVFENLDLWQVHFFESFRASIFNLSDVVYYAAVIYFFLLLATKTLEAKRWQ